ncbi:MAG: hypothetical protein AABW48_01530 [Nanoarchaeota archaeon]
MDETQKITELQEKILQKHPDWSQDKARWIALQALGILAKR